MIDYELYCQIKDYHRPAHLTVPQIARELHLHERTVASWLAAEQVPPAPDAAARPASSIRTSRRSSAGWRRIPTPPRKSSCACAKLGYSGGITIVKDYVHKIRPPRAPAFLTLAFAPGECAQVDWGQFGSIAVGNTRRRLSFFVMVLCYSRMLYVEFTVSRDDGALPGLPRQRLRLLRRACRPRSWWTI